MQFYGEMYWLQSQGVTTGWARDDGKTEYRPLIPINRDAMAAFLYRFDQSRSPATLRPSPDANTSKIDVGTQLKDFRFDQHYFYGHFLSEPLDEPLTNRQLQSIDMVGRYVPSGLDFSQRASSRFITYPIDDPNGDYAVTWGKQGAILFSGTGAAMSFVAQVRTHQASNCRSWVWPLDGDWDEAVLTGVYCAADEDNLVEQWAEMELYARTGNKVAYTAHVSNHLELASVMAGPKSGYTGGLATDAKNLLTRFP